MSLTHINNGDSGLLARTKINAGFDAIDALGSAGSSGTSGSSGSSGVSGSSGSSGTSGVNGSAGLTGSSGSSGVDGTSGSSGSSGVNGTSGTSPAGSGPLSGYAQTTSAATASVATLSMGTYSVYSIEAVVSAYDSSNNLAYGSQLFATFKNNGLAVTQISTTDNYEKSDFLSATSHIILDTDPKIVVVGETGKTINWNVNYSITKI